MFPRLQNSQRITPVTVPEPVHEVPECAERAVDGAQRADVEHSAQRRGVRPRFERIVTLDFETFYSGTYSLRNKDLNTSEYVRHPEFKAQCVGIKIDDEPVAWYRDVDVESAIRRIDWSTSALLCHHTAFDGLILSHHYGVVPAYYLDTLSMARALHSNSIGASLDTVARFYRLGNKLPDVLDKVKGVRDVPPELMEKLGAYCAVDTELCRMIYDRMVEGYPQKELDLIHMTISMFCDPVLKIDIPRVQAALDEEMAERAALIEATGEDIKELSSSVKFAELLRKAHVEPPMKTSPTTGKLTHAFSKSDLDFLELKGHPEERVRKLVAGRLAAKSTIGETRANRFLSVGADGKKLPVYLSYYGAHTGRWSGGNKMNLQNLKRGGELRRSILAPEGHVIVVADSAQIEARMTAWLAADTELLDLFEQGQDVYKYMASQIYNVPVEEITKDQRFIGKIAVLGLGYGMGWKKFQHTLRAGAMGPAVDIDDNEAQRIVYMYRKARHRISALWQRLDRVLSSMVMKRKCDEIFLPWDDEGRIWLPNGLFLSYPFLTADYDSYTETLKDFRYYDYETGVKRMFGAEIKKEDGKKIYGGLLTENIVQALARIVVAEQMLRVGNNLKETGGLEGANPDVGVIRKVVTMTHDEIVVVVPENEADATLEMMIREMRQAPEWCVGVPLNAEGGYDTCYSK